MNRILSTELSKYMKDISGATVADAEVARLKDQIPNFSNSNASFEESVQSYNRIMQDTEYSIREMYGL
jgi:uncharacterized protein YlxW (UPF0749 family)